jgi:hypothetical protein
MRRWALCALLAAGCGAGDTPVGSDAATTPDAAIPAPDLAAPDLAPPVTGPTLLSQTGLYSDFASRTLTSGLFTYVPRYPLWSDGSEKNRYLLLPPGTTIDTSDMDNWRFPVGTKMWKEFLVNGQRIETRFLHKEYDQPNGWWEIAYVWRADGSDAAAAPMGVEDPLGVVHRVPSQMDCDACHGNVSDVLIGVSAIQLSSANGNGPLTQLAQMGLLSNPPASEFQIPASGVTLEALGYLHGNCGHCHNDQWFLASQVRLRTQLAVNTVSAEESPVYRTGIDKLAVHNLPGVGKVIVVPGDPDHSQLLARMGHRDDGWEMPSRCTKLVDQAGMATVRDWIYSLASPDGGADAAPQIDAATSD